MKEFTERINLKVWVLQSNDQKDITLKEKLESSREAVPREMVCFKIMRFVYNNFIYAKTF